MSANAVQPRHRIDYVDGLRALAVVTVVMHHIATHTNVIGPAYPVLMEGAHGVDLFFVLSGFCLAFPTLAKVRSGSATSFDLADFGAKRLVRIVPPFYIATVVLLAFAVLPHLLVRHAWPTGIPSLGSLVALPLFIDRNVDMLNPSFWTLMVEFRWYFAFPLLLWLWLRSPRAFVTVGVTSLLLYHFTRARGLDFGTLPGFMLGIVAADLHLAGERTARWGPRVRRWAPLSVVPFVLIGIASERWSTIPGFFGSEVNFPYQPTILGWQLAMFAVVVAAGANKVLRRLLAMRAFVATGIASYAIYLVHEPTIEFVAAHVHGPAGEVVAGVAALGAGFAFWALAERPFTAGPLRASLVSRARPLLARALAFAGSRRTIPLVEPAAAPVVAEGYVSSRFAVVAPSSPT